MKKYEIALILASTGDEHKLVLARMILDMMELDELYADLNKTIPTEEIKKMEDKDILELLGISFEQRINKLKEKPELKNYDVALALAVAGKIKEAKKIMESVNPKRDLIVSDFKNL